MTKFLAGAAILIALGTTGTLAVSNHTVAATTDPEALRAADGAFRDGLYLGKLAAERHDPRHAAVGRWSSAADRAMFAAGYRRGYESSTLTTDNH